jgi:hypothetical protein
MMKNEHEHEDNSLLIAWMKYDARLADNELENKIMEKIVPKAAPARKPIKISKAVIIAGYCILTFAVLSVCLWYTNVIEHIQLSAPALQLVPDDAYHNYFGVIFTVVFLAALSFVSHWRQLKSRNTQGNR